MNLFEEIREIICEQIGAEPEDITLETSFIEDLWVESIDTIELATALEEKYGIEIPDEDAQKLKTVGDVVRYIEKKINQSQ